MYTEPEKIISFRAEAGGSLDGETDQVAVSYTHLVSFAGTTNGAKLTVKVGNGTAQNVTIADGKFSGTFDLAAEGKNVVTFVSTSASRCV